MTRTETFVAELILAARTTDDIFTLRQRAAQNLRDLFRDAVLQHHATNLCDCRGLLAMADEEPRKPMEVKP